jgi:hypothetical protein
MTVLWLKESDMSGPLILDDRRTGTLVATNGAEWVARTDAVMGGISSGNLSTAMKQGRPCVHLTGRVRLENNGGFVQASLDLASNGYLDASRYAGIELEILGNGEIYNLHLRTDGLQFVWQSYRTSFRAGPHWQRLFLPFDDCKPYRTDKPLDKGRLRRLGVVAIGRDMEADVYIASLSMYG